ncbi:kinesin-related protein3 [Zea mays]|uniref:Kinesin-related protein3 n=6 Tax=Zea mays TaxID=4577 RepID=A0A1D6FTT9_MAIZE|nr:kinesin-related protein3 [Zea mays]AQK94921.1 kinesin-related protein3 [Zea mays]AQK94940.1 kinesin-related protein3 [Zea mays]AQK94957.1 kinesin-related protein3 [Zea mays]AQK94958.1 kinesin-related protein3 [Zea mays]
MGSVDGRGVEGIHEANRRAQLIGWMNALLPEFSLPPDSSSEELRELLSDGVVLCRLVNTLIPGVLEGSWEGYAPSDQRLGNVKKFLSVVSDMGLPGFSLKDLDEGLMSSVVECLLVLRGSVDPRLGDDIPPDVTRTPLRKQWGVQEMDKPQVPAAALGKRSPAEDMRNGVADSKTHQKTSVFSGQKVREVFQLKRGSYSDLTAAKISEMMHSNSLDNAPTQSLISVVNGILDESIERKKGEIPHRVVYLLRKVVQEIEHRLCIQAEHIRSQNVTIKTREQKYCSKIKALEMLVNGTNEENQMAINRLQIVKNEKSQIEEKKELCEKDVQRLMKEKEYSKSIIMNLTKDMEAMNRLHEQQLEQIGRKAKEMEEQLTTRVKEVEYLLLQSNKKVEELEIASRLKSQLWDQKENIFQSYMDNQQLVIKDIRILSQSYENDMYALQMQWRNEISNLGSGLKCLVDAAENYHKVLTENQKLFNEVQELKGNIRVYCRVRPFLSGQDKKSTTIDYMGENGELLISNPFKQGKDGHRMFKFNKVFTPFASQAEVFSDIQPLIRSVLDGFNVCIFAYGQTGSGKTYTMSGPTTSKQDWGVNYRALNDLFDISLSRRNAFSYEVGVQMVEIYNEQVRDLLSNDIAQKTLGIWNTSQPNGLVVPDASLHSVKSTSDVLDLMEIGQANRAVGSTALNERSSRSHSILTVHVRGMDLKNGSTSRGCLHLIDLAGSERVEKSEVTGDRLKEAQYINKSLSALGDVIFALSQKSAHVPYRNSKLTQVLQSSLGGQAKTLMFVQINPDVESYSETISTLKFAERVSGVELGAARSNKEGKDIKELLEQVASLKDTILRKDMEIEQIQVIKDKVKSPNLLLDRNVPGLTKTTANQPSQLLSGERMLKSSDRVLSDRQSYGEVNVDPNHHVMDTAPVSIDEAGYENNASDDGLSGETENDNSAAEMTAERLHRFPSRISRFTLTKNGQPSMSRSNPKDAKTPSNTKAPSSRLTGGSSARSKRRQ